MLAFIDIPIKMLTYSLSALDLHVGDITSCFCTPQKPSVGMYSGRDYPYNFCLCTFWLCHPYFILQFYSIVFILVSVLFYCSQCNSSMPPYMVAHLTLNFFVNGPV